MGIYDFKVKDIDNKDVSLNNYKGKVLLIVNTATGCGFTPQYEGLETLYKKYKDKGLEILDFPCNQFLGQAPGTNEELVQFCQLNYGVTFKTFSKIDINGENADPLYKYLKAEAPEDLDNNLMDGFKDKLEKKGISLGTEIKWNFTKFLINQEGALVNRFAPTYSPDELDGHIAALLNL